MMDSLMQAVVGGIAFLIVAVIFAVYRSLAHGRRPAVAGLSPAATGLERDLLSRSEEVFARFHSQGFDSLTEKDQVFVAIWSLESEVNNGGFDQYFFNSSGDLWKETLSALKAIGSEHVTGLVEQAIAVFPKSEPPRDQAKRRETMLAFGERESERLSALDQSFHQSKEYLGQLLHDFVEKP